MGEDEVTLTLRDLGQLGKKMPLRRMIAPLKINTAEHYYPSPLKTKVSKVKRKKTQLDVNFSNF